MPASSAKFLLAAPPPEAPPRLVAVVDTEEEFDWRAPFRRSAVEARNLDEQWRAQEVMDAFGLRPLYVVDLPAAEAPGAEWLAQAAAAGRAEIGAHLHPWVTPPFDEAVSPANSYAGNLPPALERAKITALTEALTARFGARPFAYRAGRYGLGPNTAGILAALGYSMDFSTCPHMSFGADGGPSFYGWPDDPFWLDRPGGLLSVPGSTAFAGALRGLGSLAAGTRLSRTARRLRLLGPAARMGLIERIRLSPEVADGAGLIRAMRAALSRGDRVLTLSWHSSTLLPGENLYVRDAADRRRFLARITTALRWFRDQGGVFSTASEIDAAYRGALIPQPSPAPATPSSPHPPTETGRRRLVHDRR